MAINLVVLIFVFFIQSILLGWKVRWGSELGKGKQKVCDIASRVGENF